MSKRFLEQLEVLCYLKSQMPNLVSRQELADNFYNGDLRKVENVCKNLIECNLVSSRSGTNGGYYYDPSNYINGLTSDNIESFLNGFTYISQEELNKINFSIGDNEVLERYSTTNLGGAPMIKDLRVNNYKFTPDEIKIIDDIIDARRKQYKLRINYTKSALDKDGNPEKFECVIAPISFTVFNGLIYLNLIYYHYHDGKPTKRESLRAWIVSKIEILEHLENEKYEISENFIEQIKNRLPYEIADYDNETTFPIKVKFEGYNTFNKTFKNYYYDKIDLNKPYSIVEIKTKSYLECFSNLLSLGDTFEFVENEKSKPVRDIYFRKLGELLSYKNLSNNELDKISKIKHASKYKYKLMIKYADSKLNESGNPKTYLLKIAPINITTINGSLYLNLFYYPNKNNDDEKELCTWLVNRIEILRCLRDEGFEVSKNTWDTINSKLPYEIKDFDKEITFPIKVYNAGYNTFNRTFSYYYKDQIDFSKPYSIVEIKTRSYKECYSNLLSLKNNFEFVEKEKSKPVRDLYFNCLEELLRKKDY